MKSNLGISKNKIYRERTVENFKQLINNCAENYGENIAFTLKSKSKEVIDVSYSKVKKDVENLGTALLSIGLENKKIAIVSPDRYEWCISYFGITTSNNIAVPLDCLLPTNEIENLIKRSNIEGIIFDKKYVDVIEKIYKEKTINLKYCICMDYDMDNKNVLSYDQLVKYGENLIKEGSKKYENIEIDKDKMSILLYTSGTTDTPKAVMLSQNNICSNITAMTTLIRARKDDSVLVFLPLHHTLACTASFLFCFYAGFKICFADSIKDIAKNMKEYKISGLVCVPALLEIMCKKIINGIKKNNKYVPFKIMSIVSNFLLKFKIDIRRKLFKDILDNLGGNLRIIIYGSASTEKKVIKLFNTIGIDMLQGYGLTETSPVIACESDKYHGAKGNVGFPLYNIDVKIDNPDQDGIGEIIAKGSNVMLGYYENEEETKKIIKNGWIHTGDLGKFDKQGYLYITGRKKELIILKNGKKVYPQELEKILNELDIVEESMIYEKVDEQNNQRICAKIVYSIENVLLKEKTKKEIYKIINQEVKEINKILPLYKYIREITITDEPLKKTTTQKIKRHEELANMQNR